MADYSVQGKPAQQIVIQHRALIQVNMSNNYIHPSKFFVFFVCFLENK